VSISGHDEYLAAISAATGILVVLNNKGCER
jgi:hypothetical protein